MHINHEIRASLITEAVKAFTSFMEQVDNMLGVMSSYIDSHPCRTPGDAVRLHELSATAMHLGHLPNLLVRVITSWQAGAPRTYTALEVELDMLNEIWANILALVYFIDSRHISLKPFDLGAAGSNLTILRKCNLLIT